MWTNVGTPACFLEPDAQTPLALLAAPAYQVLSWLMKSFVEVFLGLHN